MFLQLPPLIFKPILQYAHTQILVVLNLIAECAHNGVANTSEGEVFTVVVVTLQAEHNVVFGKEVEQCHSLLNGEVARCALRIVGVEDVGVGDDYTVAILTAMLGQKVAQPRHLKAAEGAICRVERKKQILACGVCDLKPIDRGPQVFAVLIPLREVGVVVAEYGEDGDIFLGIFLRNGLCIEGKTANLVDAVAKYEAEARRGVATQIGHKSVEIVGGVANVWVGTYIDEILLRALNAGYGVLFVQLETLLKTPIYHVARGNYKTFEIYTVASK